MRKKTQSLKGRIFDRFFAGVLLAGILYTLALPPVNFWPLIVCVPLIWGREIRSGRWERSRFRLFKVYFSAVLFWLIATHWIRFPHPLTSLGWIALSLYLGVYILLFFAISAKIHTRLGIPLFFIAPPIWVALEWLRNHIISGYSMSALEHALYRVPLLIQGADLGGQYMVAFFIMFLGCTLEQGIFGEIGEKTEKGKNTRKSAILWGIGVLFAMLIYGGLRMNPRPRENADSKNTDSRNSCIRVAIPQGNFPVMLNPPQGWWEKTYKQYIELSQNAVKKSRAEKKPLDLVIWPETVFPHDVYEFEKGFIPDELRSGSGIGPPPGSPPGTAPLTQEEVWTGLQFISANSFEEPTRLARDLDTKILLGMSTTVYKADRTDEGATRYNSARLFDPKRGRSGPRYDKIHLVMFGEYVPFAEFLPDNFPLKTLCQTASRGKHFAAIPLQIDKKNGKTAEIFLAPNICFEGLVPHLIRRQVLELKKQGKEPEILVNLSNVGWFHFSSEIDFQLAAQVFRAVENRKPYLTAANGGFSAHIDADGRILQQGRRGEATCLIAEVRSDSRNSFYTDFGDLFAFFCVGWSVVLLVLTRKPANPLSPERKNG